MNKYSIRFNKSRGTPGRGSMDHAWRVFENGHEYLFKHFNLEVPCFSEKELNSDDWNVACYGFLEIKRDTSTAVIRSYDITEKNNS